MLTIPCNAVFVFPISSFLRDKVPFLLKREVQLILQRSSSCVQGILIGQKIREFITPPAWPFVLQWHAVASVLLGRVHWRLICACLPSWSSGPWSKQESLVSSAFWSTVGWMSSHTWPTVTYMQPWSSCKAPGVSYWWAHPHYNGTKATSVTYDRQLKQHKSLMSPATGNSYHLAQANKAVNRSLRSPSTGH